MQNLLVTPEVTLQPPPVSGHRTPPSRKKHAAAPASRTTGPAVSAGCASACSSAGSSKLVGIARLAHSSPRVRERTGVEYFALPARSALIPRSEITRMV